MGLTPSTRVRGRDYLSQRNAAVVGWDVLMPPGPDPCGAEPSDHALEQMTVLETPAGKNDAFLA
jgi:hypothetical protein